MNIYLFLFSSIITFLYNLIFRPNILSTKVHPFVKIGYQSKIRYNVYVDKNCRIGHYTFIGENSIIGECVIGNYCSIAPFVRIGLGEHNLNFISTSSKFYIDPKLALTKDPCIIGNDVWIGTGSVIRRGVRIGNGVVIGANSFVNKDIDDFSIVVGSPAKIIKKRFNDDYIEIINKSRWWDFRLEKSRKIISDLKLIIKQKDYE